MQKTSIHHSTFAILASIPWCCVLPAVLSTLSLTGVTVARLWLMRLTWVLVSLSALLLGRAFWLLYVKRQGAPWTRWLTWTATLIVVILWGPRLWAWIHF